jgi:ABC-type transport system involved in multi-copper enzyme maturation permease subunit
MAEPAVMTQPVFRAPGFVTAALRVFDLSLSQMLWSRRTIFMALVVGAPVMLGVLFRMLQFLSIHSIQINRVPINGPAVFGVMMWLMYLRFIVPVLGAFYGTSLIADEVEDKTITYLFTRPIPRGAVLMGKYLAYLASTVMVVLPSVVLVFFLVIPAQLSAIATAFPSLAKDLAILGIGLAVYGALFAFLGAWLRYPLIIGLVFAFGWEQLAMLLPGYLRKLTIAYYLQALVPHAMPKDTALSFLQSVFAEVPSAASAIVWLIIFWIVALALAVLATERREYILEQ